MRGLVVWLIGAMSGALGLWSGWGCTPPAAGPPVGVSFYEANGGNVSPPAPSTSASVWPLASDARRWPRAQARRFTSEGHWFGRYEAEILVSEAAAPAYGALGPGVVLPEGSVVVEALLPRGDAPSPSSSGPAMSFGMTKRAGRWTYFELDAEMRVLREGRLQPCVGCHEPMAFQDELFGVPTTGR